MSTPKSIVVSLGGKPLDRHHQNNVLIKKNFSDYYCYQIDKRRGSLRTNVMKKLCNMGLFESGTFILFCVIDLEQI